MSFPRTENAISILWEQSNFKGHTYFSRKTEGPRHMHCADTEARHIAFRQVQKKIGMFAPSLIFTSVSIVLGSGVPLALRLQLQLLLMKNQRTHCCMYIFSNLDQLKVTFRIDLVHCWPFELRRSEHCNVLYILLVRPHLPPLPHCSEPSHHDSLSPGLRPIWFSILFQDSSAIMLPFEML